MARFHAYRLKQGGPPVLVIQSDLLLDLQTRAVVPLLTKGEIAPTIARLNPEFEIDGHSYVMATQFISTVSANELGTVTADLTAHADAITSAIDFLFRGF